MLIVTELSSTFTARPGGVWTDEVGVMTSSTGIRLHDPRDHDTVHALLVDILRHPHG